jgi:lambda family phage portal protein
MSLRERITAALAALRKPGRRDYPAGTQGRLTHSWQTDPGALNRVLRFQLRTLRARSRQLCRADGYASKFLISCDSNIAGPTPFTLQAKIKRPRGSLDHRANRTLEAAWRDWSGQCDAAGGLGLNAMHRLIIRTLARDGEVLVRLRRGREAGPYGLQLQLLDIDRLDEERNEDLRERGAIKMGVEVDPAGRPRAYHVLRQHPGEAGYWGTGAEREYVRVPAEDIIHLFVRDAPEQVRGAPWLSPVMFRLWNISGFEEAAVQNARTGASKMGFYVSPTGEPPPGAGQNWKDPGVFLQDAEPGTFEVLPLGYDYKPHDPKFPDEAVEPFIRQTLRGIAAGLGVAYHSLANDPSNVNYSTARVALLEERDMWASIQAWYVEAFCKPVFEAWREMAVLGGRLPAEVAGDRYREVKFQSRTWDWVDPLKDTQAEVEALNNKLTSRTRIAAQRGEDIEDIFDELAAEAELAAEKGVDLSVAKAPASAPEPPEPEEADDADDTPGRHLRAIG